MFRRLIFFLLLALGLSSCVPPPRVTPPPAEEVRILAHYMPWFRMEPAEDGSITWEHWQWFGKGRKHDPDRILENGRRDIASVFYPLIGPYDGRDPEVLEYHMLTARAAGIQGFIADWYGPGTYSDEVFTALLGAAEAYGMKAAVCLEEKAFFAPYAQTRTRADALDAMARHIRHVLDRHAGSPAYLRMDGQPVLLVFNAHGDSAVGPKALSPEEVGGVLSRFDANPVLLLRLNYEPAYNPVVAGHYAWIGNAAYRDAFYAGANAAKKRGEIRHWFGSANPGFDDSGVNGWGGGSRVTPRRDGEEYKAWWEKNLAYQPDAVQVATWNDFQEGTTIEPTEEYRFTCLDLTEQYAGQLTDRPVNLEDNNWGWRIYKMRQQVKQLDDPAARDAITSQLDDFVDALIEGDPAANRQRLEKLEEAIPQGCGDGAQGAVRAGLFSRTNRDNRPSPLP